MAIPEKEKTHIKIYIDSEETDMIQQTLIKPLIDVTI